MTGSSDSVSALEGASGAFIALCTITVGLRFLARKRRGIDFGIDDWSMVILLPFVIAYFGCIIALVRIGWLGWGVQPFPASKAVQVFQKSVTIIVASDIALLIALGLTKASALLLYRRIFCTSAAGKFGKRFEHVIYVTLVILPLWVITFSFLAGFQCGTHLLESYKTEVNARFCSVGTAFAYGMSVSDLILDLWIICLPIIPIMRLHAALSRKLLTIGLFAVALVGVIASALRLSVFLGGLIYKTLHFPKSEPEDLSSAIFFYNVLEVGMSVISINLVVLWGLFTAIVPEQIVKMARSVASLASRSSGRSEASQPITSQRGTRQESNANSIKMKTLFTGHAGSSETHAVHALDAPPVPEQQKSSILVNESFHVSSEQDASQHV